jgi:hypothetical protein
MLIHVVIIKKMNVRKINRNVLFFAIDNPMDIYDAILYEKININNSKITVWLWNPVKNNLNFKIHNLFLNLINAKIMTFDPLDSAKYSYELANQICNEKVVYSSCNQVNGFKPKSVFFVGVDKGRFEYLCCLKVFFESHKLESDFQLVADQTTKKIEHQFYVEPINYAQYLDKLYSCEYVLDLCQNDQSGLTVRVVEAIFLNKKIITNNASILELDIYNSNNIYILGSENCFEKFLSSTYEYYDDSIYEKYKLSNLLSLIENKSLDKSVNR